MSKPELHLSPAIYAEMRAHGEQTYPHECCGVLLGVAEGEANRVEAAVRADNTRTDAAHHRYNIAPGELIRIQREGRAQGYDIVGFYHSHPNHPAEWSKTDFAEAHWLGCSYVITSVTDRKAAATHAFRLEGATEDEKRFVREKIMIPQAAAAQQKDAPLAVVAAGDERC